MRRKKPPAEIRLQVRLYAGQDDELINWLAQFDDRAYGAKSQAVKEALARGIDSHPGQIALATPAIDLAEVRQVVEAAIATALARFEGQIAGTGAPAPAADDETEELLDRLETSLVLADE